MDRFTRHQKERNLISISRSRVDRHSIQGFVLGHSRDLVMLQYVYDFRLDGLMVLRVADITEVRCTRTGRLQKDLLRQEGLLEEVPFGSRFDLRDWPALISELARAHPLVILECEARKEPVFVIGRVLKMTADAVDILHFLGAANWAKEPAAEVEGHHLLPGGHELRQPLPALLRTAGTRVATANASALRCGSARECA